MVDRLPLKGGLEMKMSAYNFTFPYVEDDSKVVLYNTRTNAMALIDNDKFLKLKDFSLSNEMLSNDGDLISNLKRGGFIIDDNINEIHLLRYNLLNSRYDKRSLGLTIAPTADCNFRCIYCFEIDKLKKMEMSQDTQERLVEQVKSQASHITKLSVNWFGGEPLLALDSVEFMTQQFKQICIDKDIDYSASMITNGYLFSPEVAKKLKSLDIKFVQITLDGTESIHNKRRFLEDGAPTFSQIVDNLKQSAQIFNGQISLRINVDRENADDLDEIESMLVNTGLIYIDNVMPNLGYIDSLGGGCYSATQCLTRKEFVDIDYIFKKRLSKYKRNLMTMFYPTLRGTFCGADSCSSHVVGHDGGLYRCWADIGDDSKKVGSLVDADVKNKALLLSYMMYDPTEDENCHYCKYLPICMGGCPMHRLSEPDLRCVDMKYKLSEYMKLLPNMIKIENEKNRN